MDNCVRVSRILFRMSSEDFETLVCPFDPEVNKKNTNFGSAISVMECLAIKLRYPAAGDYITA